MKKNVVHLTTVHQAHDPRIFYKECVTLAQNDYRVTLIAPGPSRSDNINSVKIIGLGQYKNRLHRLTSFQIKAFICALRQNGDIYHFHDPELIFTGFILKLFRKKVIYDVHEDVPKDILVKSHIPKLFKQILAHTTKILEKISTYIFDVIITVTPSIAKRFPSHKTTLVRNVPQQSEISFDLKEYQKRTNDLIYIGSINQQRGLTEMLSVSDALNRKKRISMIVAGHISDSNSKNKLNEQDKTYIKYLPQRAYPEALALLNDSKIGLVLLHPIPTFLKSYPLKLFEYMAAGLPVIASDFPEWTALINKYDCGITVNPYDIEATTNAVDYLLSNSHVAYQKGQNGKRAIEIELNWETEAQSLLATYARLTK